MTADELVRAVRLSFIEDWRNDTILQQLPAAKRREFVAAGRRVRARRRILLRGDALRNVAQGYIAGGDTHEAVDAIHSLVTWLAVLGSIANGGGVFFFAGRLAGNADGVSPQQLVDRVKVQQDLRSRHVQQLRTIAATVTEKYTERLKQLADEIERDVLALSETEIGLWMVGDPANIGFRGGAAANSAGAWRGWLINELCLRLPHLDRTPQPYATMTALLLWAGITDVNSTLVRVIVMRTLKRLKPQRR